MAVRRNRVHAADGTLKFAGIEIIARDVVVTDNVVDGGAISGLPVSNTRVKNNVLWARNTVRDCVQWGGAILRRFGRDRPSLFSRLPLRENPQG